MLQIYSRFLTRNHSIWEHSTRSVFGFSKKKEKKTETEQESSSPEIISDKEGNLGDKQTLDIHELNKEQKEVNVLPIKETPPNQERRLGWLAKKAIIFYVPRKRSGYAPDYEVEWSFRALKQGCKYFAEESKKWWKETMHIEVIKELPLPPENLDKVFVFQGPDSIKGWVTTCDSDHNEGYSTVDFSTTKDGRAVFSGVLSTRLPKDGRIRFAGYCNVRCPRKYRSFKETDNYNWISYNTVELRIRGDGRSYMINFHCPGPFDTLMDDIFNYPVYTRGGPYWQTLRIPFSKFVFSNKGRIQDVQYPVPPDHIQFISFTLADNTDGPYRLEIDYVGVTRDDSIDHEERAYEEYRARNYVVQN